MKKATNECMIIYVVYWPHLHVSVAFCTLLKSTIKTCVANLSKIRNYKIYGFYRCYKSWGECTSYEEFEKYATSILTPHPNSDLLSNMKSLFSHSSEVSATNPVAEGTNSPSYIIVKRNFSCHQCIKIKSYQMTNTVTFFLFFTALLFVIESSTAPETLLFHLLITT